MKRSTSSLFVLVSLFLIAAFSLHGQVAPPPTAATPIIIDVETSNGEAVIKVNNQVRTPQSLSEWLEHIKKTFGGDDPVIIRFGEDATMGVLLDIRDMVLKTHHEVHLILNDRQTDREPKELLISNKLPEWMGHTPFLMPAPQTLSPLTVPIIKAPPPRPSPPSTPNSSKEVLPQRYLIEVQQIKIEPAHAAVVINARRSDKEVGTHCLEILGGTKFYDTLLKARSKLEHERLFFELVLSFRLAGTPVLNLDIITEQVLNDLVAFDASLPRNPALNDYNVISVKPVSLDDYLELHR